MRYLFTLKGRFNKTHFVTGHVVPGTKKQMAYVADCGLSWRRKSKIAREATLVRALPTKRGRKVYVFPDPYPGVTCAHCLRLGHQPFFRRSNGQSTEKGDTGQLEPPYRDDR